MRGVVWSLAEHGYLAVAADYRRKVDGAYEKILFPSREDSDGTAALEWIRTDPARDPEVHAVVAY